MARIGNKAQEGSFTVAAMAAALALTVNLAFGLVLVGGPTAGQRVYRSLDQGGSSMVASAAGLLHKACSKA